MNFAYDIIFSPSHTSSIVLIPSFIADGKNIVLFLYFSNLLLYRGFLIATFSWCETLFCIQFSKTLFQKLLLILSIPMNILSVTELSKTTFPPTSSRKYFGIIVQFSLLISNFSAQSSKKEFWKSIILTIFN